ncbi:hypothetical protein BDP27DRAFT_1417992 [Rhodocollybia butyracea]|uniref:Uncharacterized protein n=1 Tax=Rhodocollybia butyracea TaxID=206335 RepID=A0A9P5UB27_9AGAR|nr:hypothetical protein BDP27DRAFT_1417992 [Rhodocollybia butyracea]
MSNVRYICLRNDFEFKGSISVISNSKEYKIKPELDTAMTFDLSTIDGLQENAESSKDQAFYIVAADDNDKPTITFIEYRPNPNCCVISVANEGELAASISTVGSTGNFRSLNPDVPPNKTVNFDLVELDGDAISVRASVGGSETFCIDPFLMFDNDSKSEAIYVVGSSPAYGPTLTFKGLRPIRGPIYDIPLEFDYPEDRIYLLKVAAEIKDPNSKDTVGDYTRFVFKRSSAASQLLLPSAASMVLCGGVPVRPYDNKSTPFSHDGDSGAAIVGGKNDFIAQLTSGSGSPGSSDITYGTPIEWPSFSKSPPRRQNLSKL